MAAPPACRRFSGIPGFCSDCGSVLPRPSGSGFLRCSRCLLTLPESDLEGGTVGATVEFNRPRAGNAGNVGMPSGFDGPLVDRRCPRCSHGSMVFHTRQTRSADEGQSVFYTCPQCRFQEKEDS